MTCDKSCDAVDCADVVLPVTLVLFILRENQTLYFATCPVNFCIVHQPSGKNKKSPAYLSSGLCDGAESSVNTHIVEDGILSAELPYRSGAASGVS